MYLYGVPLDTILSSIAFASNNKTVLNRNALLTFRLIAPPSILIALTALLKDPDKHLLDALRRKMMLRVGTSGETYRAALFRVCGKAL